MLWNSIIHRVIKLGSSSAFLACAWYFQSTGIWTVLHMVIQRICSLLFLWPAHVQDTFPYNYAPVNIIHNRPITHNCISLQKFHIDIFNHFTFLKSTKCLWNLWKNLQAYVWLHHWPTNWRLIKHSTALDHSFLTFGLTLPRLSSLTSLRNGSHTFLIGQTLSSLSFNHVLIILFLLILNLLSLPFFLYDKNFYYHKC